MAVAAQAARLIVGLQPHEVVLDEFRREIVNEDVPCIDLPEIEVVLVALQDVGAGPFCSFDCKNPVMAFASDNEPVGLRFIGNSSCEDGPLKRRPTG
jgi:hypothetical protein